MRTTIFACLMAAALLLTSATASAAVPLEMPLQGVLRDNAGTPVVEGEFEVTFAIYTDSEATEQVWTETHPTLSVAAGAFRVQLGSVVPLDPSVFATSSALWIGMTVETDPELPVRPLGTTAFAFHSASAADLACTGCVQPDALADATRDSVVASALEAVSSIGYATTAAELPYDAAATELAAGDVQGALDELKALIDDAAGPGPGDVNEGAGTVAYARDNTWVMGPFGTVTEYVHLFDPAEAKVILYLYGAATASFAAGNNLGVAYDFAPNQYSSGVQGNTGETVLQVGEPGVFNAGDHILIHQSVGTGGNGQGAGQWETGIVEGIEGGTVFLVSPLEHTYTSSGANSGRAQAVVAASYNNLEVLSSGSIHPSKRFDDDGQEGGIVFVRAQTLTVRSGGVIHADGYGYDSQAGGNRHQGDSECATNTSQSDVANCSGGGGTTNNNSYCGGGGGGNKTGGTASTGGNCGSNGGKGGASKGTDSADDLHFGGAGGNSYNWPSSGISGSGGGLVVVGASILTVEAGGTIRSLGIDANAHLNGGGAGGTVAIFADTYVNEGTIDLSGGQGYGNQGTGGSYAPGGHGGEGWLHVEGSRPGMIPENHPRGVTISIDGVEVTSTLGDPNGRGAPHWDADAKMWGADGLSEWSSGPLDLTGVANWTLGEHTLSFEETGGAGGQLKAYIYVIYPFTESTAPDNDSCDDAQPLDLSAGPVVVSGTTQDIMGKTLATDTSSDPTCGGAGGPDVVYEVEITERSLLSAAVVAPFYARLYLREANCVDGDLAYCGANEFSSTPLEPGTYYLFVDSDSQSQKGDFTLAASLTPAPLPDHDTCDDALQLLFSPGGVATHSGTTLYALDQTQSWCDPVGGGADVFYQFTAATGQTIDITMQSTGFDPVLYLYKDTCAGNEAVFCTAGTDIFIPSQAGGQYWLVVDGTSEQEWGSYDLTVTVN